MTRVAPVVLVVVLTALLVSLLPELTLAAEPSADRVVAMYFHRTKRCPTCLKMGTYSEEAVKKGFSKEIKNGKVEFHYIDFQDKKNAALKKAYRVSGPALVIAKVTDKKVAGFKHLKDIWKNAGDKKAFVKYVRDNVAAYQEATFQNPPAPRSARSGEKRAA
jgi:thiol-disulfide isomerase/thioredoxin